MLHRPLSLWENQGCPLHCSLVVRSEIFGILVHIVWEPPSSIVVIVCSLKITIQSLKDLVHISVHSTQKVLVLDLLIDCVHCDHISFCLQGAIENVFYLYLTCPQNNMHVGTVELTSHLFFLFTRQWPAVWMFSAAHLRWRTSGGKVEVKCLLEATVQA